jgi:arylsulfatase A-like enzyme
MDAPKPAAPEKASPALPPRYVPLLLGWLGAGAFGVVEVVGVVWGGRLHPSVAAIVALVVLAIVVTGGMGAVVAGALGQIPRLRAAGVVWPLLTGVMTAISASLAVWWFSDPPPFTDTWPLQGNPIAFLVVGGVLPVAAVVGVSYAASRHRAGPPAVVAALIAIGATAIALSAPPAGPSAVGAAHPNVLLVTLDTTRADRFGSHRIDTSAFDRIASEGVRFDRAMSQIPVTGPSHATMMLGAPPWETGLYLNGRPVPADRQTLAEVLHGQGYATGGFVSAWVLDGKLGYSRGFDVYDDDFRWLTGAGRTLPGRLFEMAVRHKDGDAYLLERRGDNTVDAAIRWLDERASEPQRPFFAWVHLFDAHGSYSPPPPFDTRYYEGGDPRDPSNHSMDGVTDLPAYLEPSLEGITDLDYVIAEYDGEVAYADTQLARLLVWLDDHHLADDTLVIVVGDHGEGLGEDGEWFNHGDWLYEHDLHVPCAMRLPGRIPAGRVVDGPVELDDLAPTALDWLGLDAVPTHHGVDLREAIESGKRPRAVARAVTMDREANRAARAQDRAFKPKWRMASIGGLDDKLVVREAQGYPERWWFRGVETPIPATVDPADPVAAAEATLRQTYADEARALFRDEAPVGEVTGSEADLLKQLGYTEDK